MSTTAPRRLAGTPSRGDLAVALVAFALTLALLAGARDAARDLDVPGGLLAALSCFPLLARRRSPLGVFALTAAASATLNALGYAVGPPFGPTAALFFVSVDPRTRERLPATAAVVLALFGVHVGATAIAHPSFPTSAILFGVVVWGGAFVAGDQLRQRRERRATLAERVERERRLAAAEERTRIARDLHDSAAHAINVILVQAGAARLLRERDPKAATEALDTIEELARETIGEIDRLVHTLRDDERTDAIEPVGLAALDTLVERHRSAGLALEADVAGSRRTLPPGLDHAAYRILQESLTNAARHGGGSARVEVAYRDDGLELTVSNPVAAAQAPGDGGHGILGMRERAELLGGELDAGRRDGRFEVRARLPYAGAGRR